MKQTAVQWLVDYCDKEVGYIPIEIINKAKAMEKEQIMQSFGNGKQNGHKNWAHKYYKETYEAQND